MFVHVVVFRCTVAVTRRLHPADRLKVPAIFGVLLLDLLEIALRLAVDVVQRLGMRARIGAESPDDPLALARCTVLLPARRAVRSLREAFLRASGGEPLLLPRLMPLGDLDEDELLIASEPGTGSEAGAAAAADLPPAIGGMRRQLLLARLIMGFSTETWATGL